MLGKTISKLCWNFFFLLSCNLILAAFLLPHLWQQHITLYHAVLEAACTFIPLATFLVIWHAYDRNPPLNQLICFAFLLVGVFQFLHIYYSLVSGSYSGQYLNNAIKYLIPARLLVALIFLGLTLELPKFTLHKWLGLLVATALSLGTLLWLSYSPLPLFFNEQGGTLAKMLISLVIMAILLGSLYRLKNKINHKDMINYRDIFLALLLALAAEFFLGIYQTVNSSAHLLAHLLRLTAFYYLFQGMFVSAIRYPYEQLEETGEYIANILDDLPLGIVTYDHKLTLNFANKKAEEILGCQAQEIAGLSNQEIGGKFSVQPQADQSTAECKLSEEEPIRNKLLILQNCSGLKVNLRTDIYKLGNGGFLCLFAEASKEQELANLQLQTKTILNSINSSVLVIDKNRKIILCNQAFSQLVEMTEKEILACNSIKLNQLLQSDCQGLLDRTLQGKTLAKFYELSLVTPRGNKKEVLMQLAPVINVEEEVIGAIIIASDLTALKKEQEKIQQQEKLACLGQMAAGIVHEIKNPLTTIKGFNQMIYRKSQEDNIQRYSSTIDKEVEDINKLVSDFLAFAKPSTPVLKEASLNSLLQETSLLLKAQCFINRVAFQLILAPQEKTVLADISQLKQVIVNIVKNSLEAMEKTPEPQLFLTTACNDELAEMTISITDNGIGISPEQKAKLGIPFFTTKDKGTGLGLSICYQIIKEHNGRIEVESKPGQGTSFLICLPYREQG